jgi:RNA polymerase sigma factor (sigma-70 family)
MSDRLTASRDTAALLARFREQRCPEAFRTLVENYGGLVHGVAERVLEEGESARDVTQAVFADLVRLAPGLPANTALGGWLHRHAVFLSLRQRTSNLRRGLREAEAQRRWNLDAPAPDHAHPHDPPPWRADLDEALHRLPASDRRALACRYFENQPLRAVASSLGIGEDAAQKRISRALDKLRTLLARRGFSTVSATALTTTLAAFPQSSSAAGTASLATAALQAASASALPSAGLWATALVMNTKPLLTGAIAAIIIAGSILTPVILHQRGTIAELEEKLRATPSATLTKIADAHSALSKTTAAAPARRVDARRAEYEAERARYQPLEDRIKAWAAAITQIDDPVRKEKALAEILAAMQSGHDGDALAGLTAYQRVANVEFDRAAFRPALVALLSHHDALLRRHALSTLPALPPDEGDLERITAMASDPDFGVRKGVVSGLFWLTKRDLTGESGRTVLDILNSAETPSRSLIDVMWGAQFTPELEKKIVEFARAPSREGDEQLAYYAVYSCLSTQSNKGPDCVDLLIERLSDPDSLNVGGRAAWGLRSGVQPNLGLETKIADAALKVWRNRSDSYLREGLMNCIRQYGDASHAAVLDEIAAAPAMGEEQRKKLTEVAATLRTRTSNATN